MNRIDRLLIGALVLGVWALVAMQFFGGMTASAAVVQRGDSSVRPIYVEVINEVEVDAGEAVEVCRARKPGTPKVKLGSIQDSVIVNHIRLRDYRLIADVQAVAGYRPLYKGKEPGGQRDELVFALDLGSDQRCDVVIYENSAEDRPIRGGPFPTLAEAYTVQSFDDWWTRLRNLKPKS